MMNTVTSIDGRLDRATALREKVQVAVLVGGSAKLVQAYLAELRTLLDKPPASPTH